MAASDTSICNLALQLLGDARIGSLTEGTSVARAFVDCYEQKRDALLSAYNWKFAIKRATLAPSGVEPDFDYDYAFPLPSDCLRPLLPKDRTELDWSIEQHENVPAILTNDGATLEVRYISRVTNPAIYPPTFIDALAASLAEHLCERITQSNQKKADAAAAYKKAIAMARRTNAFLQFPEDPPEDPWLAARR